MKRRTLVLVVLVVLVVSASAVNYFKVHRNADILLNLDGQIIYTKRVDGVNTLFKSEANLKNEQVIYSHKGKGKDSYGSYNDNIIDYRYNVENRIIEFVAMNNGEWSLFSLEEGNRIPTLEGEAELLNHSTSMIETDYIKKSNRDIQVFERKGSLYIIENGEERCLKKFYGFYDDKFTGYSPIGFSPNGEYFIYHSMEHLTPVATILDSMMTQTVGHVYVMDLQTQKSARYIDATKFQWVALGK